MDNKFLLLVDDEPNILHSLKRELHIWASQRKLEIKISESVKQGLELLKTRACDTLMIISDLRMPEMKGSDFLLEVKRLYPEIVTILLTGYSEPDEIAKVLHEGVFSYMQKPWNSQDLLIEVQKAYDFARDNYKGPTQ